MTVKLFDIARTSYVDGPGIRTTVFFKGCNLRCAWCHNPESQSSAAELLVFRDRCTGCGQCKEKCPHALSSCDQCGKCTIYCPSDARELCGKAYTVQEILDEVQKDRAFYDASGGGVTFSGGECMLQIDALEALLRACKGASIHTAVDTAGHIPFSHFERILPFTDLFLFDVKCFDKEKHKVYTGVGNELILSNLKALLQSGADVWVRIPVVPSVNATVDEMEKIRELLRDCPPPKKIELLPYHALGDHKYAALGKETTVFSPPSDELMAELRRVFA